MAGTCRSRTGDAISQRAIRVALLCLVFLPAAAGATTEINRVVLRVNDRIATLVDYRERLSERVAALRRSDLPAADRDRALSEAGRTVLREMLDELLLLSRGDQLVVEVAEERLDAMVERAKRNLGIENDEQFEAALAQSGLTRDALRLRMRDNLLAQEVVGREVQAKIQVPEEELQRYYREHPEEFRVPARLRLREVVVLETSEKSAEERAELAVQIEKELVAGQTLDELAKRYAADALTSGVIDLGWVTPGDLDAGLEQAVWELQPGTYSKPVAGRGGIHLLEVMEREEARTRGFSEVQEELERVERERRFEKEFTTYLQQLERQAYIQASPPPEAEGFRRTAPSAPEGIEGLGAPPAATSATAAPVAADPSLPLPPPEAPPPPPIDTPPGPEPVDPPAFPI
jgi:parvulin-like peptidyl-prolyl isomerase